MGRFGRLDDAGHAEAKAGEEPPGFIVESKCTGVYGHELK